jgi:hypothetical protein
MRRVFPSTLTLVLGLAGAALLGGCGGGTKTVSVASAPPPAQTGTTTAPRTSSTATTAPTATTTTPTSTTPTTTAGGASGPTTTRTAPAPAFTHKTTTTTTEGLSAAEAVLQAKGFSANATSEYHPNQTLRVLIGTRTGSSVGNGQQAFFFVDERYIGTDAKQPSASIHVVSQSDTEVTLAYSLSSSASGGAGSAAGQATVRFQLNNGKLTPLDPLPSASSRQ